jgi:hypothetical protein
MADLNASVGDESFASLGGRTMVINIGLAELDLVESRSLATRLAEIIEPASIWLEGNPDSVSVHVEVESEHAINRVVDAVHGWLAAHRADSASLSIGDRSYTLVEQGNTASIL